METKANHLIIGGFVVGVILLAFGFVYWMTNLAGSGTKPYDIVFEGSVSSLNAASNVLFNGIRVGKVVSMQLDPEDARRVRVRVNIDGDAPVRTNSRARIEAQGLTGGGVIQITPGSPDAPLLVARTDEEVPVIKADRATSQSLFEGAPEVMGNANALLVRLNDLIANNEDSIRNTVTNVESFTGMLNEHKDEVAQIIRDTRDLAERFNRVADKIEAAVDQFSTYVTADGSSFLAQAQEAAQSFRELADKLNRSVGDNAESLTRTAKSSLEELELFMRDGRRAAQSLDRVLQKIEKNPQSFLFGGSSVPEYNPNSASVR